MLSNPLNRRTFIGLLSALPFVPLPGQAAQGRPGKYRASRTGDRYYVEGNLVQDLRTVPLKPRPKRGGQSAYFAMGNRTMEAHVSEIPPGQGKRAHRHVNEAIIAIVSGRGYSEIWTGEGAEKHRYDWQEGSLLTIPLNCYHQHFNSDPDKPARYLAITNVPFMLMLFGTEAFVYDNDFQFTQLWDEFFSTKKENVGGRHWKVQFVEDLRTFPLIKREFRGDSSAKFLLGTHTIGAHISQIPPGKAKPAHHHINEAYIYIPSGKGYTRIYEKEGGPEQRYEWQQGSLLSIPLNYYHQHVNTDPDNPALYLAVTNTVLMYDMIGSPLVHHGDVGRRYE